MLEHVVVLSERHLVRLVLSYLRYYHQDRGHLGLNKDTPKRETRHATTVIDGERDRAATSRWTPSSLRVARGRIAPVAGRDGFTSPELLMFASPALEPGDSCAPDDVTGRRCLLSSWVSVRTNNDEPQVSLSPVERGPNYACTHLLLP